MSVLKSNQNIWLCVHWNYQWLVLSMHIIGSQTQAKPLRVKVKMREFKCSDKTLRDKVTAEYYQR